MSVIYYDELGSAELGHDGTFADFLSGKLIQSADPPPDFVDPACVTEPDIVWRWLSAVLPAPKRTWTHVDVATLPPVQPDEWLSRISESRMRPEIKRVAQELATFADFETGRNIRPAMATLATRLRKERARVNTSVARLKRDGWLASTGKSARGVIVYALTLPAEVAHNL